jgi:glycosyltransferase involved in cell wall biosynthesis
MFLGKLHPSKGALEAIDACKAINERLVVVGPVTPGDPPDYVQAVQSACDGQDIIYYPEVTEAHKLALFQGAKAIVYPVNYPLGQGESHSHKLVEAMLCGTPAIAYDQGAMSEVIDQGITGYVIPGRDQLAQAIQDCETLDRTACREMDIQRWDYRTVVGRWLPVIEQVASGRRW